MKILTSLMIPLLLLSFFSCTKKIDTSVKVLTIAIKGDLKGMDPVLGNSTYDSNETGRVYEGLLEYHYLTRAYVLQPNLAAAMPTVSVDQLTYTFKIKKGVLFHDDKAFKGGIGRELVAEDFVYTIKRIANPKIRSTSWWLFNGKLTGLNDWRTNISSTNKVNYDTVVEGLKALDKYTLQFTLIKPYPQFLYALAMMPTFAVAREVVEFYKEEFINHPVGTGPFTLKEFKRTKKITYFRNPKFRDKFYPSEGDEKFKKMGLLKDAGKKIPFVDKVVVNIMPESQPRWLNFIKGKVDYLSIPKENFGGSVSPSKGITDDLAKKGISLSISPSLDITYTAFNHDNKLFHNVKLRQAMSTVFNGQKNNDLFYNGNGIVAQSVLPPGLAGYKKDYINPYRVNNIEMAKKLLAEAGYPGGKGLGEITYDCTSSTGSRQIAEFFQQEMAKIGIKIRIETSPWSDLQTKILNRDFMLYGQAWLADYPDAENFFQILYGPNRSPGANGSGYNNPEFNKIFEQAVVMQPGPKRTKLYEQLNKHAAEQLPLIYGVHRQNFHLYHAWIRNYITTDFDTGQALYLDLDMNEKVKDIKKL